MTVFTPGHLSGPEVEAAVRRRNPMMREGGHGRRPDFTAAAPPEVGKRLFDGFCGALRGNGVTVQQGRFGATMLVSLEADGPVTLALSTDGWRESELGPS